MQNDTQKDKQTRAIENNPCSICRAFGLPICRGHGAKSGGSSGGSTSLSDDSSALASATNDGAVKKFLAQHDAWHLLSDMELTCRPVASAAVLSITLDLETGLLRITAKKNLSPEQESAYKTFIKALENEVILFAQELNINHLIKVSHNKDGLAIAINDPKYYDLFVQRLFDKNLLPKTLTPLAQQKNNATSPSETLTMLDEVRTSTAPNPFDISRGPRPDDKI